MVHGEGLFASAPRAYRVVGIVGQGGFGTVYRAELVGPGGFVRKVALKVLKPECEADTELGQRLRDEARMLAMVRHRAIVGVDELTVLNDRWTVVMELVEGADLRRLLDSAVLPVGVALEIIAEVASALQVAHGATGPDGMPIVLLHRDLKPSNVLITLQGEVKIVDFGIARGQFAGREASTVEFAFGSPGYMPPERTELIECPEGDIYSLGVVLYEIVTGQRFGRASLNRRKHAKQIEEALATARQQGVPGDVCELIGEMISFEVLSRPDARDVERTARQLRGAVDGPWLRDWARGAIADLPERTEEIPSGLAMPQERSPTLRVDTIWEAIDASATVASKTPARPAPTRSPVPAPVRSPVPAPQRSPQVAPRLPPARAVSRPEALSASLSDSLSNPWPRTLAEMPTVLVEEDPFVEAQISWFTRLAWTAIALSPVPVIAVTGVAACFIVWHLVNG